MEESHSFTKLAARKGSKKKIKKKIAEVFVRSVLDLNGALVALKVVTWNPSVRSVGSAVIAILFVFL